MDHVQLLASIDHCVLYSGDSEQTLRFYRDVLGCPIHNEQAWRDGAIPVFQIEVSATQLLNVHPSGAELHPRARHALPGGLDICFRSALPSTDVVAHLEQHGIAVEEGPVRRKTADGQPGSSVYFRDPDGNLVEVMSSADLGA